MYNVLLIKQVTSSSIPDKHDVYLWRRVELPYAPFYGDHGTGLSVVTINGVKEAINEIIFHEGRRMTYCITPKDRTGAVYNRGGGGNYAVECADAFKRDVDGYRRKGWEILENVPDFLIPDIQLF